MNPSPRIRLRVQRMLALAVAAFCVRADDAGAQDWTNDVLALRPSAEAGRDQAFLDEMENRAKALLEQRTLQRARTPGDVERARPVLRQRLEQALGFRKLPSPSTATARITGTLKRPGYRIEKFIYESLPGCDVAAHLYIPEALTQPAPGILFYNGHWWAESKTLPDFQAFCITMARLGFVVLSFDPFGQGERGVSVRDHRRTSALLAGIAQQGIAEHETRCALQQLLARPEVDAERIGMTGASGGGYNTWMTAALDERIKVAVPVVGTSEFLGQIQFARGIDWRGANEHCHFVPGLLTFANNHELLAAVAPRPLLIINSTRDPSFRIGDVYEYGRSLYHACGVDDRIAFLNDATAGHGYQQKKREAAYGWFLKWLMKRGDGTPVPEEPLTLETWDSAELRSFGDGQKRPAGPAIEASVRAIAAEQTGRSTRPSAFFGSAVPPAIAPPVRDQAVQRLLIRVGNRVSVPLFLVRPPGEKGLLFAVADEGKESLMSDPVVQRALAQGWAICGIDVRGIGELATDKHGWLFAVSLLAGDNFVWRQAADLLAVAQAVHDTPPFSGRPAALYARGHATALAASYAIGESARFQWYVLCRGFLSFRQFLDRPGSLPASFRLLARDQREERFTAFDREIPFSYFPFNVLEHFDLPQLLASSPAEGFILDPLDGDWNVMKAADARRVAPNSVRVVSSIAEILPLADIRPHHAGTPPR